MITTMHSDQNGCRFLTARVIFRPPPGAYNLTQSMQFIGLRPTVVLIGLDSSVNVICRREKLIVIENGEQVPTYLQLKAA
jgi:hypothetical protein